MFLRSESLGDSFRICFPVFVVMLPWSLSFPKQVKINRESRHLDVGSSKRMIARTVL